MKFTLLDPIRGLAALWVVCFHLRSQDGFTQLPEFIQDFFRHGNLGVPIFFVISGFCIMHSMRSSGEKKENPLSFLLRRAKRIYIPFWGSVIVVCLLSFLTQYIHSLSTGKYISPYNIDLWYYKFLHYSFQDWIQVLSLTQIFDPMHNISGLHDKFKALNGVYWSIAIEMQFYIVMFVALLLKNTRTAFLLIVTLASIYAFIYLPQYRQSGLFVYHWHYFVFGIIINTLFHGNIRPSSFLNYKRFFQVCCGGVLCFLMGYILLDFRINKLLFIAVFCIFLWLLEIFETRHLQYIKNHNKIPILLSGLGAVSYSIYLLHSRLIHVTDALISPMIYTNNIVQLCIKILLTLGGCYCFYLLFEKSFYQKKNT